MISHVEAAKLVELDAVNELRAQYVACRYLATACREAATRLSAEAEQDDMITPRALELIIAIERDWQQTLWVLAQRIDSETGSDADRSTRDPVPPKRRRAIVQMA